MHYLHRKATYRPVLFVLAFALLVASCAEDGPINPAPGETAAELVLLTSLYNRVSDPDRCDPGILADAERQKVLRYINEVRAAHGLSAVVYAAEHDEEAAASALISAANDLLSHQPPTDLRCWTEAGFRGSGAGNLGWASRFDQQPEMAFSSEHMVDLWWTDDGTASVGHRRWMLNPFLTRIAFGRVDKAMTANESAVTAATLWVINDEDAEPRSTPVTVDFVAYPFEQTPSRRFSAGTSELSFTVIGDKTNVFGNQNINLSLANIRITDPSGNTLAVTDLRRLHDGSGVPNALVWRSPVEQGVRYDVVVTGISIGGEGKRYDYGFEVGG